LIAIVSINLIRNIGREAIINALKENSTVIVMGETGSGKTTRK
jgi:HrpA-like RNA helicase